MADAQPLAPTDKQLEDFAVEEQFLLFCDMDEFTQIARAVLAKWGAQPVPAGYALVPVEPTPEMLSAMWVPPNSSLADTYNGLSDAYNAMLAAAPQPTASKEPAWH